MRDDLVTGVQTCALPISLRAVIAAGSDVTSRPTSGAAFLTARKAARDATASLRLAALAAADAAFDRLGRHAKDARRRERRPEAGVNPPVLEAAFLVTAGARARFKAEARRQAAAGAPARAAMSPPPPPPPHYLFTPHGPAASAPLAAPLPPKRAH